MDNSDFNFGSEEDFGTPIHNLQQQNNNIHEKKKEVNMELFVKNLESDLENFQNLNLNQPIPSNLSKNMITKEKNEDDNIITDSIMLVSDNNNLISSNDKPNFLKSILNYENRNIILYILLFMILNNKFIIQIIYDIPYINKISSTIPNLLLRSFIFGLIIFLIKKFL